jgi:hypothetical protein
VLWDLKTGESRRLPGAPDAPTSIYATLGDARRTVVLSHLDRPGAFEVIVVRAVSEGPVDVERFVLETQTRGTPSAELVGDGLLAFTDDQHVEIFELASRGKVRGLELPMGWERKRWVFAPAPAFAYLTQRASADGYCANLLHLLDPMKGAQRSVLLPACADNFEWVNPSPFAVVDVVSDARHLFWLFDSRSNRLVAASGGARSFVPLGGRLFYVDAFHDSIRVMFADFEHGSSYPVSPQGDVGSLVADAESGTLLYSVGSDAVYAYRTRTGKSERCPD